MQSSSDYLHTLVYVMSRKHKKIVMISNQRKSNEKDETERNECVDCTKITIVPFRFEDVFCTAVSMCIR